MTGVRRSLLLTAADSYVGVVLTLAGTMVVSRLLTPEEIGIFAVAAVFSALAVMFRDMGVAEYMIQEKDLTREKIAAAFALNLLVSWAMAAALFAGAPAVGAFYGSDGIGEVMRVLAVNFLLVPFGAISMAYFRRQLDFRPILICNLAGRITGFAGSVSLALAGFGYMSLAWSSLASTVIIVSGTLWFRPQHFPRWPSLRGARAVFDFSKFASSIYILSQVGKGAPEMIIGRAQGMTDVAMFSRAGGLIEIFRQFVMQPVTRVCLPYLARSEREEGTLVPAYLKSVSYLTAAGWPFLLFLAMAAFAAVRIVYGPQWDAAVPLARILCVACSLELVHILSREALLACGQARRASLLQAGLLALQVCGLMAVVPFGLEGAAWGLLAASAVGVGLSQWHLHRAVGLRTRDMAHTCVPSALVTMCTLVPATAGYLAFGVTADNYIPFAILGSIATAAAWLGAMRWVGHPMQCEVEHATQWLLSRWRRAA